MDNKEKASISIKKIVCVSIILILISGIVVMAADIDLNDIKITLQNGYELKVLTSKTTVSDILKENSIVLDENQKTIPALEDKVSSGDTIKIVDKTYNEVQIAKVSEEGIETSLDQILENYAPITEKIVVEQVAIPFETITKNSTDDSSDTQSRVLQQGKEGLKEITYKVKYQNEVEIEKIQLSERVVTEPVNKIVQVTKVTSRSSALNRTASLPTGTVSAGTGEVYKVTAYCPCAKCCGKSNGITAAGTRATAGRTVAAPSRFAMGTTLNVGGHSYVVEDRGGAISGNRIDIFVNSHAEALAWGVKYLNVSVE